MKHSIETRKKISEALKGHKGYWLGKKRPEIVGDKNPMRRKEVVEKSSKSHLGFKQSEETKRKIGNSLKGKKSYAWKGDDVSYSGIHHWIKRELGKPQICELCRVTAKERKLQWANKDHKYKRKLSDWISLCVPCHRKYDREYKHGQVV